MLPPLLERQPVGAERRPSSGEKNLLPGWIPPPGMVPVSNYRSTVDRFGKGKGAMGMAGTFEGSALIGRFGGTEPVVKGDGTAVPGMFNVKVIVGGGELERELKAAYFSSDMDGEVTAIYRALKALDAKPGDPVIVRIKVGARAGEKGAFANLTATNIQRGRAVLDAQPEA